MPLNAKKLKNTIKSNLDKATSDYSSDNTDTIDIDLIVDPIIEELHNEIEKKLQDILSILTSLNTAIASGMTAIVPPGTGAAGTTAYGTQMTDALLKLAELQTDLKKYQKP